MDRNPKRNKRWIWIGIILILGISCILVLSNWAAIGTSLANPMRKLLGVERVAQLESMLFNIQDSVKQWQFRLGIAESESPWEASTNPGVSSSSDAVGLAPTLQTPSPTPAAT